MVVANDHAALLKKLKAQVRLLKKKEEQSRHQFHTAFKKIHKLGTVFKSKLEKRMRQMQNKMLNAHTTSYAKTAAEIERKVLNKIKKKTHAVVEAIAKFEKQHAKKTTKRRTAQVAKKRKKYSVPRHSAE